MKAILLTTLLVGAAGIDLAATTPLAAAPLQAAIAPIVSDGTTLVETAHYRRRRVVVYATPYYRPYYYQPYYYGYTYYAPRRSYRY